MAIHPNIRRLDISRFRCIEHLEWRPDQGVNVLVGGGDSGKSTVLHAIALLFSPTNMVQVFETDYFNRSSEQGFSIEAVVELPEEVGIGNLQQTLWPWAWNKQAAVLPNPDVSGGPETPVYRFRARGTNELELTWEVIQPNDEVVGLPVGLRRKIGVVRLANDDRNDRDLRLVAGSALDRLLSSGNLKSRINKQIAETDLATALLDSEIEALRTLGTTLEKAGLPHDLALGLTSSQGLSIGALIGLLASRDGVMLPLASWGAGTRRMSSLEIAASTESATRLTIIDEIERGLEPYRLRQLIAKLDDGGGQCFVTTHSPVAVAASGNGQSALWFVDAKAQIGSLPREAIERQQKRDPETFLAKLPIIAEGVTEVGFLRRVLRNAFTAPPAFLGLRVCDGGGNDAMLGLLEALRSAGLSIGAFCDDEGRFSGRWKAVSEALGPRFFQWSKGCLEENVIKHVMDKDLMALALDPEGASGRRLRTIAVRLNLSVKDETSILNACGTPEYRYAKLRSIIIAAATGDDEGAPNDEAKKEWRRHSQEWFKSLQGGAELAVKAMDLKVWPKIEADLLPFINALGSAFGQAPLSPGALKP
ncbi:ATP-dependent endonuclease of the OLD family-like protein [Nitrobacter hamburgensis X14]|uniref:ATP-dependent endonuclease of the OLD family-like protein n=1 Tax=Nitrobacter hamburgensis (strain DSM 10229 / NCIMB 13809 / X14) TaxID=323097 RepID=Q1QLV4_NITHX|nr:ATP-binding protein [Nitrobacter hamburgensis]ABE62793.1 ATP-dependent endonuclease of the OLD family-like protein [Nitrobacter hamburgensis X14]